MPDSSSLHAYLNFSSLSSNFFLLSLQIISQPVHLNQGWLGWDIKTEVLVLQKYIL